MRDRIPRRATVTGNATRKDRRGKRRQIERGSSSPVQNALYANKGGKKARKPRRPTTRKKDTAAGGEFKFRCHRCGTVEHKAAECTKDIKRENDSREKAKKSEATSLRALVCPSARECALRADHAHRDVRWCLDSGATSHLSNSALDFDTIQGEKGIELNLANGSSTSIRARGEVFLSANVLGKVKDFRLIDALHVPDLRTNLLSVGKITDNGYKVIFNRDTATVCDSQDVVKLVADRVNGLLRTRRNESFKQWSGGSSMPFHGCRISRNMAPTTGSSE